MPRSKQEERERLEKLRTMKDKEFQDALWADKDFAVKKFKEKIRNLIKHRLARNRLPQSHELARAMRATDAYKFQEFINAKPHLRKYVLEEMNKARRLLVEKCEAEILGIAFGDTEKMREAKARLMSLEQVMKMYKSMLTDEEEDEIIELGGDVVEFIQPQKGKENKEDSTHEKEM